jgi:hypothetical protein
LANLKLLSRPKDPAANDRRNDEISLDEIERIAI